MNTFASEDFNSLFQKLNHEIRGPISTLLGIYNLAMGDYVDDVQLSTKDIFNLMNDEVIKLNTTVSRFAYLEQVITKDILNEEVDFKALCIQLFNICKISFPGSNVTLEIVSSPRLLYTDKYLLNIIMSELITNTMKYAERPSKLYIELSESRNGWRIVVEDDGKGIPAEVRKYMFSFFQPGNSLNKSQNGLGLFLVRKSVERLKGKVCYAPTDTTTRFIIEVPGNVEKVFTIGNSNSSFLPRFF